MSEIESRYFNKYIIEKADGTPVDPEAEYFVLRIDKDPAARVALCAYARATDRAQLAADIFERMGDECQPDAEVTRLRAEVERLEERVCDECDGSGTYYVKADGQPESPPMPCVCVSETESYQHVAGQLAARVAEITELKARIAAMLEVGKMIPDWLGSPCQKSLKHYSGGGRGPYRPEDSDPTRRGCEHCNETGDDPAGPGSCPRCAGQGVTPEATG